MPAGVHVPDPCNPSGVERNEPMPSPPGPPLVWGAAAQGNMTIRVLGPHERGRFAPEAWGHLLALSGAGALNPAELEQVIERAMLQFDGRIALDDLRSMMEGSGFDDPGAAADTQTVH